MLCMDVYNALVLKAGMAAVTCAAAAGEQPPLARSQPPAPRSHRCLRLPIRHPLLQPRGASGSIRFPALLLGHQNQAGEQARKTGRSKPERRASHETMFCIDQHKACIALQREPVSSSEFWQVPAKSGRTPASSCACTARSHTGRLPRTCVEKMMGIHMPVQEIPRKMLQPSNDLTQKVKESTRKNMFSQRALWNTPTIVAKPKHRGAGAPGAQPARVMPQQPSKHAASVYQARKLRKRCRDDFAQCYFVRYTLATAHRLIEPAIWRQYIETLC